MNKKYPDEFKQEAVRQVLEKGFSIPSVAKRLGISDKSLYYWVSKAKKPTSQSAEQEEIRKLKADLKRVTEERNILKEAAVYKVAVSMAALVLHMSCAVQVKHVVKTVWLN